MALRVLVTGASGALGAASVRALRTAGHDVVGCGRVMESGVDAKWDIASQDGPEPDQRADSGQSQYPAYVLDRYTDLPDAIPDRVLALAAGWKSPAAATCA